MSIGRGKRITGVIASAATVAALTVGIAFGQGQAVASATAWYAPPGHSVVATASVVVPQRAWDTLARIDAGTWPPNDGSGTEGGRTWTDAEGTLPRSSANGDRVNYREWDVNEKRPGHTRDAERIVTGDDGSAWYTGDHYATFTRMR